MSVMPLFVLFVRCLMPEKTVLAFAVTSAQQAEQQNFNKLRVFEVHEVSDTTPGNPVAEMTNLVPHMLTFVAKFTVYQLFSVACFSLTTSAMMSPTFHLSTSSGRVHTFSDPISYVDIDLDTLSVGPTYNSFSNGGNIYRTVSLGDFNGDGTADLMFITVAPLSTDLNFDGAYVLLGQSGVTPLAPSYLSTWEPSDTNGFSIVGTTVGEEYFGAGGGDYNNDGFMDILFSHFAYSSLSGVTYVIYGHNASQSNFTNINLGLFTSGPRGYRIIGGPGDKSGQSVANAGDVNSDDYDDIIVCSQGSDEAGAEFSGACYVLFGQAAELITDDVYLRTFTFTATTGFKILGSLNGAYFASSVSGNFDFNNDSYSDVLIGHTYGTYPAGDEKCIAYVIFGHENSYSFGTISIGTFVSSATVGVRILADIPGTENWNEVFSVGDVNHDGFGDVMIEATLGYTAVIFGSTNTTDISLVGFQPGKGGFLVTNAYDTGSCGDVNADGIDDLVFGIVSETALGRTAAGIVVVLFGKESFDLFVNVDLLTFSSGLSGVRLIGQASAIELGNTVGSAGDFNGDGFRDLVLSAYKDDNYLATQVYVLSLLGPVPSPSPTNVPTIKPTSKPSSKPTTVPKPTTKPSTIKPSRSPTLFPTVYPTITPTANPTVDPTVHPTIDPTIAATDATTLAPTTNPFLPMLQTSPSYRVRNGFAFCAIASSGELFVWGEGPHGGALTTAQSLALQDGVTSVVASRFAYAAQLTDGTVHAWGVMASPSDSVFIRPGSIVANEASFAALIIHVDGVVAFGSEINGGNVVDSARCSHYVTELASGVSSLAATAGSFAALKNNGEVYAWGNVHTGGGVSSLTMPALSDASAVFATRTAFAALLSTGAVVTWGDPYGGGNSSAVTVDLALDIVHVVACRTAFVAVKGNGGLVVWGHPQYGGDAAAVAGSLASGVSFVAHTFTAIAALKRDKTVVTWGKAANGGDSSSVQPQLQNITLVVGNSRAFAALTTGGAVIAWGQASDGGTIPADKVTDLSSDVIAIYHTNRAFAALKSSGQLVVWGQAGHGGSPGAEVEALLLSGVHTVCSNDAAFSVIKDDGTVVAWGHPVSVPQPGVIFTSAALLTSATCA